VYEGSRILNVENVRRSVSDMTYHAATCELAKEIACESENVFRMESVVDKGYHTILNFKCVGCETCFKIENSDKFAATSVKDINVRCVWGSMVTGGGCSSLNESMGTVGVPGISEHMYSDIEAEIGRLWKEVLDEEMLKAGEEERRLALQDDETFQGVPAITVVCDGGWSKRAHKHTYNAMAGVGVIFGARTNKLLHIGIRNKLCYQCIRDNIWERILHSTHVSKIGRRHHSRWNRTSY